MSSISKPDHCAERASLALLSAYEEYLMTFKLMTSQVVQRARPLITYICVVGIQRVNVRVIFQNTPRIKSFFPYKYRLNRSQLSKVIYKASCWDYNDIYIGKTMRRLHDRKTEHFKALSKHDHSSAIADHFKTIGHNIKWDHFHILASGKTPGGGYFGNFWVGTCHWDPGTLGLYLSLFSWILLPYTRVNSRNPPIYRHCWGWFA